MEAAKTLYLESHEVIRQRERERVFLKEVAHKHGDITEYGVLGKW